MLGLVSLTESLCLPRRTVVLVWRLRVKLSLVGLRLLVVRFLWGPPTAIRDNLGRSLHILVIPILWTRVTQIPSFLVLGQRTLGKGIWIFRVFVTCERIVVVRVPIVICPSGWVCPTAIAKPR
jgi:hypothetical protein